MAAVPTTSYAAYEEFLRGNQKMISRTIPDIRSAAEHYRRSIELDPAYAMAYAGLADAYFLLRYYGNMSVAETNPLLESAVTSALELDPDLGEAHTAYASMLVNRGLAQEAVAAYEEAIELAPGYARSLPLAGRTLEAGIRRSWPCFTPDYESPGARSPFTGHQYHGGANPAGCWTTR